MAMKNVADALVHTLVAEGVKRIYAVAGESLTALALDVARWQSSRFNCRFLVIAAAFLSWAVLEPLYQSIIAPLLATLIGSYYGH